MNVAYLCLGGNIGDREAAIEAAISGIGLLTGKIIAVSSIYETEAWGVEHQQAYLNCCVGVETDMQPSDLLNAFLDIERELGRQRNPLKQYEARTIDIDILFFNEEVIQLPHLIIPHPRLQLRKFVLVPMHEIAPHYLHPVLNKTIFNLLEACEDVSDVRLYKQA